MGLMMLAAGPGTTITVAATGTEATQVIEALAALVSGRLGRRVGMPPEKWEPVFRTGHAPIKWQDERARHAAWSASTLAGLPKVGDEGTIFARLVGLVLDPQQERRVDGDEGGGAVAQPVGCRASCRW